MKKADLFVQTQRKLTYTYAWLIIVFLMLFSLIVSVFFLGMAYREQRQILQTTLYATENGSVVIPNLSNSRGGDLYFFYIVDTHGNMIAGSEAFPQNRDVNLEMIERWHPHRDKFRLEWLPESDNHHDAEHSRERDQLLFVGARPFMTDDGKEAFIYTAKDVTFYFEAFQNLLLVLLFILVLFLIASIWLSYSMSKKAMIPIQRAYRQQQQFLADASHELRTPLSVMNTSLDVIELENGEDFSPYTREVVSDMKEEVGRMSRMVQHLLMLARSDSGSVEFEMVSFDLVPKVSQWVLAFEAVAHKKQIMITTRLPEEMEIKGDIERIKQLVYILLDNAIKYTSENGTVDVALGSNPKQWYLSVQDTGIGIPEDGKQRIFDRFYRVEKHRSREEGSAGLGLSIAKWIVEAHRGSIEVESSLGEGSTFIVKFPHV
ncbi:sensor histidine kinase [Cohnella nanjingensis]|uniref:histidine kinase n=1 Tax=Cohnella nanjingensis TaxID=1387779 RepID=A0A7X0VGP2_9BACL|nr:HAMP domain-containing sensor histidine kinase [Cohnella nanjingensis]MBB6671844.1 HAMP domain-containing histidine kinase [Cohnella nanjingensis]